MRRGFSLYHIAEKEAGFHHGDGAMRQKTAEDITEEIEPIPTTSYIPKTPLGRRLWEIRARIVASGEPLLGWEEIEREVAKRKG
jgi:hypothetical protein